MVFRDDIFRRNDARMISFIEKDNVTDLKNLLENDSITKSTLNKTISTEGAYYMSSIISYEPYEMTPLCAAAIFESPKSMQWLLENGAQSSINTRVQYRENFTNMTPLIIAVIKKNLECVQILLDYNADPHLAYTDPSNQQRNAFSMACCMGHPKIVKEFIKRGLVNLKEQDNFGYTPLHLAALFQKQEVVQILLENGAADCLNIYNNSGLTPLSLAQGTIHSILNSAAEEYKNISDTASKNTQKSIMTPSTNTQTAEQSKATETKSIDTKQSSGYSKALMVAVAMDNAEEIEKILQDKSININATDFFGNTPLLVAIASGSNKAVQALLKHNADIDIKSAQGLTVEKVARGTQNADAIQLISHAKILRLSLKEQNQRG